MRDLVSVIMPAYNAEKYIEDAIESVLAQEYPDWELLVVDDCSTDRTRNIVQKYVTADKRIRLISLRENRGVATARNTALQKANGRYIAFLDSDDMWYPGKLARQTSYMKENNVAFTFTAYEWIDETGNRLGKRLRARARVDFNALLGGNPIGCLTVMLDREKIGFFEMPDIRHEDYATWLHLTRRGFVAYGIDECLALYRKSKQSLTFNKLKSAVWTWKIYKDYLDMTLVSSIGSLCRYSISSLIKYVVPQ